ncbi:MAG: AAA family ATPase [bacterium]|nr:AAA family ATPase [bacterium]
MISKLLLHHKVRYNLEQVLSRQPHGLLLTGPEGSGKQTVVRCLAAEILGLTTDNLLNYPYIFIFDLIEKAISIESIRNLQQFLKLKVPAKTQNIRRIIIIDNAERMKKEAQNALLKTLEEPPEDTMIIMSVNQSEQLLPTITSRMHEIALLPLGLGQANDYFTSSGASSALISRAHALSQGQAGLMYALVNNKQHELSDYVDIAKSLLGATQPNRLLRSDELSKDKTQLKQLLLAFSRITHAALQQASLNNNRPAISKWLKAEIAVTNAANVMSHNPNTKLLLDDLFLNL